MEANVNQYYFNPMPHSRIVISEEIYKRLLSLVQTTRIKKEEQMCIMVGKEIEPNVMFFDIINQATDYVSTGGGSDDPSIHGVNVGDGELKNELRNLINQAEQGAVFSFIHTHPSGVNGDNIKYRTLSNADLTSERKRSEILNERGLQSIAGMISVDRQNGNSNISFVYYDREHNKFYRAQNVMVAKKDPQTQKWTFDPLARQGNSEYLEIGFRPTVQCTRENNYER